MQMDMSSLKGCVQHLTLHTSCLFLEACLDIPGGPPGETDPGAGAGAGAAPRISEAARSVRAQDALRAIAEVQG